MMLGNYTIREFARHPGRTLLTLGGIVIGVAGVFAIALTVQTTRNAYRQMFADLAGSAELEIVAEGGGGFDPALATKVAEVSGVRAARPVVQMVGAVVSAGNHLGVMVIGAEGPEVGSRLSKGKPLAADDEILLVDNFARGLKVEQGATIHLLTTSGGGRFRVAGLLEPSGVAGFNGGAVVFVSLPAARRLFKLTDEVTAISIELDPDANPESVRASVAALLPSGLTAQSPATRGDMARHSLLGAEQGLSALSAVSVVAGAFVILNAFLMSLSERRRQLAILRAVGVTSGQVTRLLLREAALLGIVGMVLGIGAGLLTSLLLVRGMERLLAIQLHHLEWSASPFVQAALLGPAMALCATLIPAWQAARRPPLADLLGLQAQGNDRVTSKMARLGLLLGSLAAVCITAFVSGWIPEAYRGYVATPLLCAFLISGILLTPTFYPYLARGVARLFARLWGIEGRLAVQQLDRNATRSGLTAAILCVALVISIAMGQTIRNNIRDIEEWTSRTFTADFMVRGCLPELSYSIGVQLPEALHGELAALPGVETVHELNLVQVKVGDEGAILLARSFDDRTAATLDVAIGDRAEVIQGLLVGQAVIGTALAQRLKLHVGDELPLRTRKGEQRVRVAGAVTEYVAGGMALFLERQTAKRLFQIEGVDVYMITAQEGAREQVGQAVQKFCDSRELMFQSNAEFRERIHQMMGGIIGFLWLLMALVFIVASLGIVNTLTMNVLEQTREIAVLRSVALLRRQVRAMILYQALTLSLCSLVPGTVMGLFLAWLMNLSTHVLLGQPIEFYADGGFILACCAACLAIAWATAWIPARRAARLEIVAALQYE